MVSAHRPPLSGVQAPVGLCQWGAKGTSQVLEAWLMELPAMEDYSDANQLTRLFLTENDLLIHALSRELSVPVLSQSRSPFL